MAREKRWTIPFVSLNGVDCHIDIYKEGWTGGVTELSPDNPTAPGYAAADCFYYEEGHQDDILNNVIQYRTGYIQLYELSNGSLQDLYPTTAKEHYVEFYFGNRLDFTGYMQVQAFSNAWVASPREIAFPIISPLGLLGNINFMLTYPPVNKTLGSLLDEVIDGLQAAYTRVVLPNISDANLSQTIFSLFVSPWNENYHHSTTSSATDVFMNGDPYEKLIDAICKAYGWVCHDTPGAIIFSMFDYQNAYYQYPVGHVGDTNYFTNTNVPYTAYPLTNWFTHSDDGAMESVIMPYSAININYEGDTIDEHQHTFDRTAFRSVTGYGDRERTSVCNLDPITNETQGAFGEVQFDSNNRVSNSGAFLIAHENMEGVLVHLEPSLHSGSVLFTVRFYAKTQMSNYSCDFTLLCGDFIANLQSNSEADDNLLVIPRVLPPQSNYVDVQFVLNYQELPTFELIFITNIKLNRLVSNMPYAEYQNKPAKDGDKIEELSNQPNEADLTMPISPYRLNMNTIGDTILSSKITEYPYLFKPRLKLVSKFKGLSLPDLYHTMLYSFWLSGMRWRLMALSFHPWTDDYTLTLNRSTTLET